MSSGRAPVWAATRIALFLTVAVGLAACSPTTESPSVPAETERGPDADQTGITDVDGEWLTGTWEVEHTLDQVTSALFQETADVGTVEISIDVRGSEMELEVDGLVFVGVIVVGGDNFRYEGSASYEEEGVRITAQLIVDGTKRSDTAWTGDAFTEVATTGGTLYEAVWTQEAHRSSE